MTKRFRWRLFFTLLFGSASRLLIHRTGLSPGKPDSPAMKLGVVPIDLHRIGLAREN